MLFDYFFFYKYLVRFISIYKFNIIKNTYQLMAIKKLILFFAILNIEDIDDVQGYNYLYLFKFFFGSGAYLTKLYSTFNLGVWRYSFNVFLIINKKDAYNKLFFIINDLIPSLELVNIVFNFISYKNFYIIIKDVNTFGERKTNLGLFFLRHFLNIKLWLSSFDMVSSTIFLKNLKIQYLNK